MSKSEKPPEARQNQDEATKTQPTEKDGPAAAPAAGTSQNGMKSAAKSSEGRHDWLARGLRQFYDKALQDPMPQSFQDLLDKLDERDCS
jgi:hypothetical protein